MTKNRKSKSAASQSLGPGERSKFEVAETCMPIASDLDIIRARQTGRAEASKLGVSSIDLTLIATAISELARNIVMYAKEGEIILRLVRVGRGTVVTIRKWTVVRCP